MNDQNTPQKTFSIYTLSCPKTGVVRYVGATKNPKERIRCHIKDAKNKNSSPVHKWINSLLDKGLSPIMDIVDTGDTDTWQEKEKYWIQRYKDMGCALLNQTDGGLYYKRSEESCRKWAGENNPNYGKPVRGQHRQTNAESHKIPVSQYSKDGVWIRNWDSGMDASIELEISATSITACCKRRPHYYTAGGFIWRYADDPLLEFENED